MQAIPNWMLYVGAILLAALAFRLAGAYSRVGRSSSLNARIRAKRRRRKAAAAAKEAE